MSLRLIRLPYYLEEVSWAATTKVTGTKVPLGDCCEEDYEIAIDMMKFESLSAFRVHYEQDTNGLMDKMDVVRHNKSNPLAPRVFSQSAVNTGVRVEVEVARRFKGIKANEVRSQLDITRLGKATMNGIPEMSLEDVPEGMDEDEEMYLYPADDTPNASALDVVVRCISSTSMDKAVLTSGGNLWEQHAKTEFDHQVGGIMEKCGLEDALGKCFTSFDDFVAANLKKQKAADPTNSAFTPARKAVQGKASEEFKISPQPDRSAPSNLHADLSSAPAGVHVGKGMLELSAVESNEGDNSDEDVLDDDVLPGH